MEEIKKLLRQIEHQANAGKYFNSMYFCNKLSEILLAKAYDKNESKDTEKNPCCKENMMPHMPMTGWKCRKCGRISN